MYFPKLFKQTKQIDADTANIIKMSLHLMFRTIFVKLNNQNVSDTTQLYLYSA